MSYKYKGYKGSPELQRRKENKTTPPPPSSPTLAFKLTLIEYLYFCQFSLDILPATGGSLFRSLRCYGDTCQVCENRAGVSPQRCASSPVRADWTIETRSSGNKSWRPAQILTKTLPSSIIHSGDRLWIHISKCFGELKRVCLRRFIKIKVILLLKQFKVFSFFFS